MRRRRFLIRSAALALLVAGCANTGGETGPAGGGVLDVARANGATRFVAAIDTAGLTDSLAGEGPYTVFAPRNAAVGGLPADPEALEQVVAYHVVPGMLTTSFMDGMTVNHTTATGSSVTVDGRDGLRVGDATVVATDLSADNGVVHIIDRVLTPR